MFYRKFGGFTFTARIQGNARELMNIIGDEANSVDMQRAYVAAFDAPQNFWSRHNEVAFLVVESEKKKKSSSSGMRLNTRSSTI